MQSLPLLTGVDKNKRQEDDSERNVRRRVEGARLFDELPWEAISSIYEMIPFENEELETLEMIFQSRHFPPQLRERAFNFLFAGPTRPQLQTKCRYVPDLTALDLSDNEIGSDGARGNCRSAAKCWVSH